MSLFHLTSISNLLKIVMEIEEKWNRLILLALNAYQFEQRIFLKQCHLMALLMTRHALKTFETVKSEHIMLEQFELMCLVWS